MFDLDLLYVTYRQQELWHEAAAPALTAKVYPARPCRWARVLDTLTTVLWQSLAGFAALTRLPGACRGTHIATQT